MENIAQKQLFENNSFNIQPSKYDEVINALEIKLLKYEELKCTLIEIAKEIGLNDMPKLLIEDDQIIANSEGIQSILRIGDIKYIITHGKDSSIFTFDSKKASVKKNMSDWEKSLPADLFTRISRSVIINLNFVEEISKCNNGTYKVKLSEISTPITISRKYMEEIKSSK